MKPHVIASALAVGALLLTACGGDDDAADAVGSADTLAEGEVTVPLGPDEDPEPTSEGTATLTLANGENYSFSVLCNLEGQTVGDAQIAFSVTSFDTPSLDITKFGSEGQFAGSASIAVYDATFETLWEAATLFESFGGTIEVSRDGSTVSGTGSFYPAADPAATPVDGEVVANC